MIRYTAPWCAPCKAMQPVIDPLRDEGYDIIDVNVDDLSPAELRRLGVLSVPTFKTDNGVLRGVQTYQKLLTFLNN